MPIIILFFGLIIGSFLNVCIYRIPQKEDIVFTPSHCSNCGKRIKAYDLIPIISYIILGGKCRNCKVKISIQYPLIELLNAVAYQGIFLLYGLSIQSLLLCALTSLLIVISVIDYRHYVIPNGLVIAMMLLGIVKIIVDYDHFLIYLIGFFTVSLILLLIAILTKGKMGGGDIKLMAAAGLFLGWQQVLLALMIGSLIGALIGIVLIALKVIDRKQMIPFGPFLSLGIIIAAIFGNHMIQAYINLLIIK